MPNKFPMLKDGDVLTPRVFNLIFTELNRWRGMAATGLIGVDSPDGTSPPTIVDNRTSTALLPAVLTTTLAAGTTSSPSTGTMTLLAAGTGGALSTTGGTTGQTVYNTLNFSSTLASGTHIWVASFAGLYYLNQASC